MPAAHAIRPPSPAELQLKEEKPLAYWSDAMLDAEMRNGLFCVNDPLRYTDPTGHYGVSDWWRDVGQGAGIVGGLVSSVGQSIVTTVEKPFVTPTIHWDPNSYNALSGGTFGPQMPGVGNPATAPVKAGANALVQAAMVVGPMGEEKAAGAVVKEGETLFRGVPGGETEKAILGKLGIAKPRGTALDAESLAKHVRGEDVNAGVTSWTTDREVAKRFAGSEGKVIEVNKSSVANQVVPRPPVPKYAGEKEVLLKGTIQGTPTTP